MRVPRSEGQSSGTAMAGDGVTGNCGRDDMVNCEMGGNNAGDDEEVYLKTLKDPHISRVAYAYCL